MYAGCYGKVKVKIASLFSLDPFHYTRWPQYTLVFSRPQNQLIGTGYESDQPIFDRIKVCLFAAKRIPNA